MAELEPNWKDERLSQESCDGVIVIACNRNFFVIAHFKKNEDADYDQYNDELTLEQEMVAALLDLNA